jgi:hypothetical protein
MNAKKFRGWCSACFAKPIKRGRTKYCSIACSLGAQRKPRAQCLNECGRTINLRKNIYCSLRCMQTHRHACRVRGFVAQGGVIGHVPVHFLANLLRELFGERCSRCGWAERHEITGRVPVEVEHIDGDWRNNRLQNLTLLCPNCHSLTATFRALNRGRGRAHRLGGRSNPRALLKRHLAQEVTSTQKVFRPESLQLQLVDADVAERLNAPHL